MNYLEKLNNKAFSTLPNYQKKSQKKSQKTYRFGCKNHEYFEV